MDDLLTFSQTGEAIDDDLSTVGEFLINLDGLEPQVPRGQPFGLWETTHMNMSRMREGRNERASKLEDFGRAW